LSIHPENLAFPNARRSRRRGSIYIAVLGVSLLAVTLGVGGILAVRAQARGSESGGEAAIARLAAQSGLELARLWMNQDPNWRTTRVNGNWVSGLAVGSGTVTIDVTDPIDGNLQNRPYDPVLVTATGHGHGARHALSVQLEARAVPLPTLAYALHVPGQLRVRSNRRVVAGSATLSTNGSLRNEGTIEAAVHAGSVLTAGVVYGGIQTGVTARSSSPASTIDLYANLGTEISGATSIDLRALGPGINPWGTPNADGVYVIRSSSDVTIQKSRILGTLVVICPGRKVALNNELFMEPARADYPVLIVVGNLEVNCLGAGYTLSESSNSRNYNPSGAPHSGVSDNDKTDTYPCEIRGLVHVTGTIQIKSDAVFRGALISESTAASEAIDVDANPTIRYLPQLYTNPPQGFTSSVMMIPLAGSVRQVVD
jgi:hypothetical protein